jgi:hypothetical protein
MASDGSARRFHSAHAHGTRDSRSLGHFEFLSDANCRGRARGVATISSEEMLLPLPVLRRKKRKKPRLRRGRAVGFCTGTHLDNPKPQHFDFLTSANRRGKEPTALQFQRYWRAQVFAFDFGVRSGTLMTGSESCFGAADCENRCSRCPLRIHTHSACVSTALQQTSTRIWRLLIMQRAPSSRSC